MFSKVKTAHLIGIESIIVEVEIYIGKMGLPAFTVVGLAEGAVKESRDRVKASLKSLDFNIFAKPITINLATADFKKEGTHFDLPIAIGLLMASGYIKQGAEDFLFIAELSLDGHLRNVPGILSMVIEAKNKGIKKVILSEINAKEAAIIEGIDIYGFDKLSDVIGFVNNDFNKKPYDAVSFSNTGEENINSLDLNTNLTNMLHRLYLIDGESGFSMLEYRYKNSPFQKSSNIQEFFSNIIFQTYP